MLADSYCLASDSQPRDCRCRCDDGERAGSERSSPGSRDMDAGARAHEFVLARRDVVAAARKVDMDASVGAGVEQVASD